jgi:hypothetical protein
VQYTFKVHDEVNWWSKPRIQILSKCNHFLDYARQKNNHIVTRFFFKKAVLTSKLVRAFL